MKRQIDHIGIAVADLDAALALWQDALGVRCEHIEELEDRGLRIAMLPIGDTRIELISPMHEQSEISAALQKRGPGLHHLALRSENVDSELEQLADNGVQLIDKKAKPGADGAMVGFVHPKAASGVLLELCQPGTK